MTQSYLREARPKRKRSSLDNLIWDELNLLVKAKGSYQEAKNNAEYVLQ